MGGAVKPQAAAAIAAAAKRPQPVTPLALALRHRAIAEVAKSAVAKERELRAELVAAVFPKLELGMNTHDFGGGYVLKVEVRPNPKFDGVQLAAALTLMRKAGDLGKELAERLVKFTPELRVGEYNKLPGKFADMLVGVVEIQQATPTAELTVPD